MLQKGLVQYNQDVENVDESGAEDIKLWLGLSRSSSYKAQLIWNQIVNVKWWLDYKDRGGWNYSWRIIFSLVAHCVCKY